MSSNNAIDTDSREAVRLADQPDRTAADVARELGIHVGQIYNWHTQFKKLSKGQLTVTDGTNYSKEEITEIRRLKKVISELKQERDFLKKRRHTSRKPTSKVCSDGVVSARVHSDADVSSTIAFAFRLLCLAQAACEAVGSTEDTGGQRGRNRAYAVQAAIWRTQIDR